MTLSPRSFPRFWLELLFSPGGAKGLSVLRRVALAPGFCGASRQNHGEFFARGTASEDLVSQSKSAPFSPPDVAKSKRFSVSMRPHVRRREASDQRRRSATRMRYTLRLDDPGRTVAGLPSIEIACSKPTQRPFILATPMIRTPASSVISARSTSVGPPQFAGLFRRGPEG